MIAISPTGRQGRALRSLALVIGGWVLFRLAAQSGFALFSSQALPPGRMDFAAAGASPVDPFAIATATPRPKLEHLPILAGVPVRLSHMFGRAGSRPDGKSSAGDGGDNGFAANRHAIRLAFVLPSLTRSATAPLSTATWGGQIDVQAGSGGAAAGPASPQWLRSDRRGWAASAWLFVRSGDVAAATLAPQLGGSQAGGRIDYGFGPDGRLRAYARLTSAGRNRSQAETAVGIQLRPLAGVPFDIAVEQRQAIGRDGRTALSAIVAGGIGDVPLGAGFRIDAYGQAGVVGAHRRDAFADGAAAVITRIAGGRGLLFDAGGVAAGAAQPGARRLDLGPRIQLRLPQLGEGARVALDWRQRVAGNARPASGIALTLATGF